MAEVVRYEWDMGDGTVLNVELPTAYRYREPGVYTITRTAFLDDATEVSYSRVVSVNSFSLESLKPDFVEVIYRYGETVEEGLGPSEVQGDDFPFHSFGTSALNVQDVTGNPRMVVFDNNDRKFYEVTTVGGNSAIGRDIVWKDKVSIDGTGGTEYTSTVHFRAVAGTYEKFFIEMLSANVYTRAIPEERQGVGVTYNNDGYPTGIEADITIQADEKDGQTATSLDIDMPKQEIHFDRRVEGHIIQLQSTLNKAPHIITGYNANVLNKDKLDSPTNRQQPSEDKQQVLSFNMINWITRGVANLDRITRMTVGVTWSGMGVTGPDGYGGSTFDIGNGDTLSFTNASPLKCLFWYQSGTALGSLPVGYVDIDTTVSGWVFAEVTSTSITFGEGTFFDLRTYLDSSLPVDFDTESRAYLINDIKTYNGKLTLPAWVS